MNTDGLRHRHEVSRSGIHAARARTAHLLLASLRRLVWLAGIAWRLMGRVLLVGAGMAIPFLGLHTVRREA